MKDHHNYRALRTRSEISRRDLIRRAALLGIAGSGLEVLTRPLGAQAALSRLADQDTVKAAATLRVGAASNFEDFDPHHEAFGNYGFINQLYGTLLRDHQQPIQKDATPWLATSITLGANGRSATVVLRPNVTFHSGAAVNSAALIANLEKISDPKRSDQAGAWQPIFDSATAVDNVTTSIKFKVPVANELLYEMFSRLSLISPGLIAKGENALKTQADGTGAFKLQSYAPGVSAMLVKNPHYWNPTGTALDGIEYTFFSDANAMTASLESGGIDLAIDIPDQDIAALRGNYTVVPGPLGGLTYDVIVSTQAGRPFESEAAREALQYITNRQRFVQEVLFNTGAPAYVDVAPTSLGWEPSFTTRYKYDPTIAHSKFKTLGMLYKKPIQVLQLQGILPGIGLLAEIMSEEMNNIGLNASLVPLDASIWGADFYGSNAGNFDMVTSFIGRANRYPSLIAAGNGGPNAYQNDAWKNGNPPVAYRNAYLNLISAQTSAEQRKWALAMEDTSLTGSWDIAVAYQRIQYVMSKNATGFADSRDDWPILEGVRLA